MTLEEAIVDMLKSDSGVAAITGRIYPLMIPQAAEYPLIVYQRITGARDTALDGPSGLAHPRMQIDAYAETYEETKRLATAIRKALYGKTYAGEGIRIGSTIMVSDTDFYEPAIGCYRVSIDFAIWHNE